MGNRAKYIAKAKAAATFQDAIFFLVYFNNQRYFWRVTSEAGEATIPDEISPEEIFDSFDEQKFIEQRADAANLLGRNAYIGAVFFKYPDSELSYEQALARMQSMHPGYCEEVYSAVAQNSIQGMR